VTSAVLSLITRGFVLAKAWLTIVLASSSVHLFLKSAVMPVRAGRVAADLDPCAEIGCTALDHAPSINAVHCLVSQYATAADGGAEEGGFAPSRTPAAPWWVKPGAATFAIRMKVGDRVMVSNQLGLLAGMGKRRKRRRHDNLTLWPNLRTHTHERLAIGPAKGGPSRCAAL
jgi:hypothetical protein